VLIITDRTELDEQIHTTYIGVDEEIHRTKSGADLIEKLNANNPWLICSLIHKFTGQEEGQVGEFMEEIHKALPKDFSAKGDIYVFVDECHRTQSGALHQGMKQLLPNSTIIGFTGTPLMKADKKKSIEVFGSFIHTYKFDEAVADGVVLDLRYEARDVDQYVKAPKKIDQWFKSKTKGLTDLALAQLKARWGTMQKVLSSKSRLETIVSDILLDFETRDRLQNGRGNAILVAGSIYEACKYYELFQGAGFTKCAIVTSYVPSTASIKGEETGEGQTEKLEQFEIYNTMLNGMTVEAFEIAVKKRFIEEPGQMRLLIVVDKLLTGFDAPSATYLYIDKQMRDHGLFQAICRVNRLDGDDKEYGYIIDYKDLFKSLENAVDDYTSGALDGFDKEDVAGLLENRLEKAREDLEDALETVRALCETVAQPKDSAAYRHYFCCETPGDALQLKDNEPKRLQLYKHVATLIRAYAAIAGELAEAGYTATEIQRIKTDVEHFTKVRDEIKLSSGDYIDLKAYEPAMRYLIDTYIRAEDSEKISAFDDFNLIQLIVERGPDAVDALPDRVKKNEEAVAETIENNVRKLIINESPIDPAYYDRMSKLLDALIEQRRKGVVDYKEYLAKIADLSKQVVQPHGANPGMPTSIKTGAQKALYNNLWQDVGLALQMDGAIRGSSQDGWKTNVMKTKLVRKAIRTVLEPAMEAKAAEGFLGAQESASGYELEAETTRILELAKHQHDY